MECLLTTLKESVNNDKLLKVGEFRIGATSAAVQNLNLCMRFTAATTVKLSGGATFTDNGTDTMVMPLGIKTSQVTVPAGNFQIKILNKYNLWGLGSNSATLLSAVTSGVGDFFVTELDMSQLLYSQLAFINLNNGKFKSNISGLSNSPLEYVFLSNLSGNMTLVGDVASLVTGTAMSRFSIEQNQQITGDISAFAGKSWTPPGFTLRGTGVTGSINNLSGINCISLVLSDTKISGGDIGTFNDGVAFVSLSGVKANFTFSDFSDTRQYILAGAGVTMESSSDVDDFLIANAALSLNPGITSDPWFHAIAINGARTSASDAAVATLQGLGVTVALTPIV